MCGIYSKLKISIKNVLYLLLLCLISNPIIKKKNYNFRNIGIVILVAGFATVFVALMYCTCICKEGRRVAPDGSPQNVSKLKCHLYLFFQSKFFGQSILKKERVVWCL